MTKSQEYELVDFTPYLLNQAAEAASLDFARHYKSKYAMLRTEWRVIFHLGQFGPMTAKSICDRARIHKTKVSRAVAALEQKRYLERTTVDDDRRHALLSLTRGGKRVFDDLFEAAQQFDLKMNEEFSAQERAILRKCLLKIAKY